MKEKGYTVDGIPATSREMLEMVVTDSSAKYASPAQAPSLLGRRRCQDFFPSDVLIIGKYIRPGLETAVN